MDNDGLFQLKDGEYVLDEEYSTILNTIVDLHPIDNPDYAWNDIGLSELFVDLFREDTLYCPEKRKWYTFNGQRWEKDEGAILVNEKIKLFAQLMIIYASQQTSGKLDDKTVISYTQFVAKLASRPAREKLLKDAQQSPSMAFSINKFDANPYLINCKNGTYDLESGKFYHFKSTDYLTYQTNCFFPVKSMDFKVKRWDTFLEEIMCGDKDLIKYLQKCLGYSLSGVAKEEKMFIFYGQTTRNGKGTLLNTIQKLLGDYATNIDVNFICRSRFGRDYSKPNPMVAGLKGTRMVVMNESDDASKLDESLIKNYTGNDPISTRELYGEAFSFFPQFTMFLSANNLPEIYDKSIFSSERVSVIPFNRHFNKEEQDPDLKQKFSTEEAKTYIFKWLIEGWQLYQKEGLNNPPTTVEEEVAEYEKDNDIVALFLDDRVERTDNESDRCYRQHFYQTFKNWCVQNGIQNLMSSQKFYKNLERLGIECKRCKPDSSWYVVKIILREK